MHHWLLDPAGPGQPILSHPMQFSVPGILVDRRKALQLRTGRNAVRKVSGGSRKTVHFYNVISRKYIVLKYNHVPQGIMLGRGVEGTKKALPRCIEAAEFHNMHAFTNLLPLLQPLILISYTNTLPLMTSLYRKWGREGRPEIQRDNWVCGIYSDCIETVKILLPPSIKKNIDLLTCELYHGHEKTNIYPH